MVNPNTGIPLCESTRAVRYDSVVAYFGYAKPDDEASDKRYQTLDSKNVSKFDDDRKVRHTLLLNVLC